MTTLGLDAANYQAKLNLRRARTQGYEFVMILCTQGAGFASPTYARQMRQAKRAGYLAAAYHFLEHGNIAAQVANLAAHIGDKSIRIMLDCEPTGSSRPTMADAHEFRRLAKAQGMRVTLLYLPGWYHAELGRPNLRGWSLVQSAYPGGYTAGYGSRLYPGDTHPDWAAYGGVAPAVWQFTSSGRIDGYSGNVDLDAFRGDRATLAATGHFTDYAKPRKHTRAERKAKKKPRTRGKAVRLARRWIAKIKGGKRRTEAAQEADKALRTIPFERKKK